MQGPVFIAPAPGTRSPNAGISSVGLTAIVAVLHLVVLAGRISARHTHSHPRALLTWQAPDGSPIAIEDNAPSKPTRSFCAGELELTFGMTILALAQWLHIMRLSGIYSN